MAAPQGNKFALGNRGGRPTILNAKTLPKILKAAEAYLQDCEANPIVIQESRTTIEGAEIPAITKPRLPNIERCALICGVSVPSLMDWSEGKLPQDYLDTKGQPNAAGQEFSRRIAGVLADIRAAQKATIQEMGAAKVYDGTFARFLGSANHGMTERVDHTTGGKPMPILGIEIK